MGSVNQILPQKINTKNQKLILNLEQWKQPRLEISRWPRCCLEITRRFLPGTCLEFNKNECETSYFYIVNYLRINFHKTKSISLPLWFKGPQISSLMDKKKYLNKPLSSVGPPGFHTAADTLWTATNDSATCDIKNPNQCHFYIKSKRLCFPP